MMAPKSWPNNQEVDGGTFHGNEDTGLGWNVMDSVLDLSNLR